MNRLFQSVLLPVLALTGLCACATVKRFTPDLTKIPLPPLPKFSTLKKVVEVIPGMPKSDKAAEDDPKMPFNARSTLGYGHTLRIHVFEGARNPKRVYNGVVMVDSQGMLDIDDVGQVRVGGNSLPQTAGAIESLFRVNKQITRPITVHIVSVEDVPVVSVTGDVIKDEFIPSWEGMTIAQAVRVAGGRKLGSSAHGVYLIRNGMKRYFTSLEAADKDEPEPGDIITLSPDI
jgi:hypothetical protein